MNATAGNATAGNATSGKATAAPASTTAAREMRPAPMMRQIAALARAEGQQLLRNKVALLNCFALPLIIGVICLGLGDAIPGGALATFFPIVVIGTALLFVVYYTLVTAFVARRESLLLKRLRAGEASDSAIVAGIAAPFVVITMAQAALAVVAAIVLFDARPGPEVILVFLAALLGTLAFAGLAVASTPYTRTVEHAQITTLPVILVPLLLSGLSIPLDIMPDAMRAIARLMPLTPVVDLVTLGMSGGAQGADGLSGGVLSGVDLVGVLRGVLVLLGWSVLSWWFAARTLRWEARS